MTLGSATVAAAAAASAATWARSTGIAEAGTRPFSTTLMVMVADCVKSRIGTKASKAP